MLLCKKQKHLETEVMRDIETGTRKNKKNRITKTVKNETKKNRMEKIVGPNSSDQRSCLLLCEFSKS